MRERSPAFELVQRADSFVQLANAARELGLRDLLERPATILIERARARSASTAAFAEAVIDTAGRPSLVRFLIDADVLLAKGSTFGSARKPILEVARQEILEAATSERRATSTPPPAEPRPPLAVVPAPKPARPPSAADVPATVEELRAWARDQKIAALLTRRIRDVVGPYHPRIFTGYVNATLERATVEEVLTSPLFATPVFAEPFERRTLGDVQDLHRKTRTALADAAVAVERAIAEEHEEGLLERPLPKDEARRALSERVRSVYARIRPHVMLRPRAKRPQTQIVFEERTVPVASNQELGAFVFGATKTELELTEKGELPLPKCTCGEKDYCVHRLELAADLLRILALDGDRQLDELARMVSQPPWMRALAHLDRVCREVQREEVGPAPLVWWLVSPERSYGEAPVTPLIQESGKRGAHLKPKVVSADTILEKHAARLHAADRELVEMYSMHLASRRAAHFGAANSLLERLLRRLVGHPRVVLDPTSLEPVRVEEAKVELVATHEGHGLGLVPSIAGQRRDAAALLAETSLFMAGNVLIEPRPAESRVLIVELSETTKQVVEVLSRFRAPIPFAERHQLLSRLPMLEAVAPVRFEGDLPRTEVTNERRIVLRLVPDENAALTIHVGVRPLAGGPVFTPGQGPEEVTAARNERELVFARRNLDEEPREVSARVEPIVPGVGHAGRSFTVPIIELEDALDVLTRLRDATDLDVEWPAEDPWRVTRHAAPKDLRVRLRDAADWFGLEGTLEVDGEQVALAALLEAVRKKQRFVRIEGRRFVAIGEALRRQLEKIEPLVSPGRAGLEISDVVVPELEELTKDGLELEPPPLRWQELLQRVEKARTLKPKVSKKLRAELRPYQVEGHAWLARLAAWGVGGILADDMGLGKTLQAIAILLDREKTGPALVVAPMSVTFNWMRELERFAPSLSAILYRGPGREVMLDGLGRGSVLVVSYGLLVRDLEQLEKVEWGTVVLDEAQVVKNASSHRAKAVRALRADWRLALSGTPVENHLGELWSIFRAVIPGLLGGWEQFRERFVVPIERDRDASRSKALAALIRPFVLRRTKALVAKELPPRTEIRVDIALSEAERRLYEEARLAAVASLTGLAGDNGDARFHVLAAITRLRQLACHPRLADPEALVGSSKLARLVELARGLIEAGQRALVFSQFTKHLALVRAALDDAGIAYVYLDGATAMADRAAAVDEFQAGGVPLFLISLKAGGTGLNLTAADNVIHLDPWWNPAVEDQATDRAHRIGQTKPVTVYRLVTVGTIEEQILQLHADKRALVSEVLDGTGGSAQISTEELLDLLRRGAPLAASDDDDVREDGRTAEIAADEQPRPSRAIAPPASDPPMAISASPRAIPRLLGGDRAHLDALVTSFGEWLDDEVRADRYRPSTASAYAAGARRFADLLRQDTIELSSDMDAEAIREAYARHLATRTLTPSGVKSAITALRVFLEFASFGSA